MKIIYDIQHVEIQKNQYYKSKGKLLIETDTSLHIFEVCSGGYKRGTIPIGRYIIGLPTTLPDTDEYRGFKGDEFPWGAPLTPIGKCEDSTGDRTGLYIHARGTVEGTLGCLEILKDDVLCYNVLRDCSKQHGDMLLLEVH